MDTIALPQALLTIEDLKSLGGLVVAVYVIVNVLKEPLKKLGQRFSKTGDGDWVVRPFCVLTAFLIMIWMIYIRGTFSTETIGLAIINSFIVTLITGATHDYIVAPTKRKIPVTKEKKDNSADR